MFRPRYAVALMTNAVLVGALLILVVSLGWFGWAAVLGAAVAGFVLSWPAAALIARLVKIEDPDWDEPADRPAAERRAASGG
jgi:hypothetical protein